MEIIGPKSAHTSVTYCNEQLIFGDWAFFIMLLFPNISSHPNSQYLTNSIFKTNHFSTPFSIVIMIIMIIMIIIIVIIVIIITISGSFKLWETIFSVPKTTDSWTFTKVFNVSSNQTCTGSLSQQNVTHMFLPQGPSLICMLFTSKQGYRVLLCHAI